MAIFVKVAVCGKQTREFRVVDPKAAEPVFTLRHVKDHNNRGQALEYASELETLLNPKELS